MFIYRKPSVLRSIINITKRLGLKEWLAITLFFSYLALMFFSFRFRFSVFLYNWVPQWTTALTVGAIGGLWCTWKSIPRLRIENKPHSDMMEPFLGGMCFFGMLGLMYYDYVVWFFPEKTVSYITDYNITVPGPSRGKSGQCEAGLKIKDQTLGYWITLCSSKKELQQRRKPGMDGIYVVEQINHYGIRLISNEFTNKN